ncbi:ABC transporter substrate-binding protein [Actinoplanes couchii]|uniref:ABC transporter substrate-binding protein n=1 Tax=Actinoplanes couchii TaxID=403638 RepID=A0ABQ3X8B6_9ACTN|nr:ABC transporter substrate-binding protein [Actinoplanes couchii]MDR6320245.1 multiple sugar transport system substrate-binding protein [Actinoplanes couchii]GID54742.1 ABC transporter substrate-binding protein [Actinoplanes couchii]
MIHFEAGRFHRLAAVAGVLTLTACSSPSIPTGPDSPVVITWWTGQTDDAGTISQDLAREYEATHPNVRIRPEPGASNTDGLLQKLSAGLLAGRYPDISYAYGSWAIDLDRSDRIQDLTEYSAQPEVHWAGLPSAAREVATVNGRVIGVPALVDNVALIYNRDLFDRRGLAYPNESWTWADFRAAAKALTGPEPTTFGTAFPAGGGEDALLCFWPLFWQLGGAILDGTKPAFNSGAGVGALETLRAMTVDDRSAYPARNGDEQVAMFKSRHIGMILSGPWVLAALSNLPLRYGVVRLPGTGTDHQTVSGPDLWVLFDHDDPDRARAARDFVTWLTSDEIDVKWNLQLGNLPLRETGRKTMAFRDYVKRFPGAGEFAANTANVKQHRPAVAGYADLSRNVGDAVAEVLRGYESPRQALDEAAASTESMID